MPEVLTRSLPGIRFVSEPPPLDEVLPRMDIAVFVGFAARGPLHTPIVIEDAGEFEAIFGPDAPLAWDPERGEVVRACLGPAVRAFFRNGGTRCWVVRVAGAASTNVFPLPGLAAATADGIAPAFASAASPGSWSDGLRVGTALALQPLEFEHPQPSGASLALDVRLATGAALAEGDVLRLQARHHLGFMPVERVAEGPPASPPSDRKSLTLTGRPLWFRTAPAGDLPPVAVATIFTARREPAAAETFAATVPLVGLSIGPATGDVHADLQIDIEDAPDAGSFVSIDLGDEQLLVAVHDVGVRAEGGDGDREVVHVRGRGFWWLRTAPALPPEPLVACARLQLHLTVRETEDRTRRATDLGLAAAHARYLGRLPHAGFGAVGRERTSEVATSGGSLVDPAFPLRGRGGDALYVPLDVTVGLERLLPAARQPRSALERDGLAPFTADLFLDPELAGSTTDLLLDAADHLRHGSRARELRGIHAALTIEEATLVAVPDASHRGWTRDADPDPDPPAPSAPLPHQAWWRGAPCTWPPQVPLAAEPPFGRFLRCGLRVLPPPRNLRRLDAGQGGTYTLAWDTSEPGSVLEEARRHDFGDAVVIYRGTQPRLTIYGRSDGTYYYRVRATSGDDTSDWSAGHAVRVATTAGWQVVPAREYSSGTLLSVQRALLRIAAARGDLFAVLGMPAHFREGDSLAHARELRRLRDRSDELAGRRAAAALPLAAGEARALSFGALYHPWLLVSESDDESPRSLQPPDGAIAGLLADRARRRGAWIAAANAPLAGVLATAPPLSRERRGEFLDAQVNVVTQEPRGFLALSADTLGRDSDLLSIGVRRLLSLLRRLALREGVTYVFEPHDATFRRLVQRSFESFLSRMFERGAFAGRTAETSFRVVTSDSLNTPQSVDQGRFLVELRVAPALPLSFLTVRLVQSGDRTLVVEGR